ncbi:MAG: (5-formylfuran-3-yl)methyl phosphate synthase [Methylophilus sp.]|nr:(5-formylfuran-3-yl)methyl phosphate synthase [Methylophilus sp.]
MTRLLISVKNPQEALQALDAGADFIDLKDPQVGALGSLDDQVSSEIIRVLDKRAIISATVGEYHENAENLLAAIENKAKMGVDIVKLPISTFLNEQSFVEPLLQIQSHYGVSLIAVFFADLEPDFNWIAKLAHIGFYGAMLDTAYKHHQLLCALSQETLSDFVKLCKRYHMQAGLAGSLRIECIQELMQYQSDYLGFRSGVCERYERLGDLSPVLIAQVKDVLCQRNKFSLEAS